MRFAAVPVLGMALLAATPATAQKNSDVTVRNQRLPAAEAPKSATCEAAARDPLFRQQVLSGGGHPLMGPRPFLPTRMPRNPDYSAPPLSPVGSPLPALPKNRFGASPQAYAEQPGTGYTDSSSEIDALVGRDPSAQIKTVYEQSVDLCRSLYAGGSAGPAVAWNTDPSAPDVRGGAALARLNTRFVNARAYIVQNDTTLPTAFALFDQRRFAEALPWFRKAATKLSNREGGDEAMLFVGKLELQGLGASSNPAEGVKWLKKAATLPYQVLTDTPIFDPAQPDRNTAIGEAAIMLANVYRTGFGGIPRDMDEACRWYERAEAVGHLPAAKMLGDIYLAGDGVKRDPQKAVRWYRRAAEYDIVDAQIALARIFAAGDAGVPADPAQALAWYRAAARHGHGGALYALARAYDDGRGVTADPQRALGFYKAAALRGLPEAKVAVGTYFHEGTLVPQDDRTARQWFEAAARDRDVDGMFNLAALMANGRGGPRDLSGALTWLKRAQAGGHPQASAAVAKVEAMIATPG